MSEDLYRHAVEYVDAFAVIQRSPRDSREWADADARWTDASKHLRELAEPDKRTAVVLGDRVLIASKEGVQICRTVIYAPGLYGDVLDAETIG